MSGRDRRIHCEVKYILFIGKLQDNLKWSAPQFIVCNNVDYMKFMLFLIYPRFLLSLNQKIEMYQTLKIFLNSDCGLKMESDCLEPDWNFDDDDVDSDPSKQVWTRPHFVWKQVWFDTQPSTHWNYYVRSDFFCRACWVNLKELRDCLGF